MFVMFVCLRVALFEKNNSTNVNVITVKFQTIINMFYDFDFKQILKKTINKK